MNTALNNFYLIEPYFKKTNDIADAIYRYDNSIDVTAWRGNAQLMLAKIVSADKNEWVGSILGNTYTTGDLIIYDPTCVIKHFADGTKLVRDDAIVCLFNEVDNAPGANKNQVVLKIERNVSLEMLNVMNGFYGTVIDIQIDKDWNKESKINTVKIGDKIILVNPYRTDDPISADVFRKVSTTNGFYVVAEVDAIACKIEK